MNLKPHIPKIVFGLGLTAGIILATSKGKNSIFSSNGDGKYFDEYNATPINAKEIATTLHETMRVVNYNSQERWDIILNALSTVSPEQFGQIVKAFGLRSYHAGWGNDSYHPFQKLPKKSLKFWLNNELSKTEYATLRSRYSKFL